MVLGGAGAQGRFTTVKRLAALALAAVLGLAACGTDGDGPPPPTAPAASVENAVRVFLIRGSIVYAGNCADTDIEADIGKWCSTIVSFSPGEVVVDIGPTFSEYATRLTLVPAGNGYRVESAVPIVYPALEPLTVF